MVENLRFNKDKIEDFKKNYYNFGFKYEPDKDGEEYSSYICQNKLNNDGLYIQITISLSKCNVYVELNCPKAYWIELDFSYFYPIMDLYKEGYLLYINSSVD